MRAFYGSQMKTIFIFFKLTILFTQKLDTLKIEKLEFL